MLAGARKKPGDRDTEHHARTMGSSFQSVV